MLKHYPLDQFKSAVEHLAAIHEVEVRVYEGDDQYSLAFATYKDGKIVGGWPISMYRNARGTLVLDSAEYLLFPVENIPGSSHDEFLAALDMLVAHEQD